MSNLEYIKDFVTSYNNGDFGINYGNAMSLANAEEEIARYICEHYPTKGYGFPSNILGKYDDNFSITSWTKIDRLSKNDETLQQLIQGYVDCAKFVERIKYSI